ncbi:hypothetical protein PUN28_004405 [Cardiocondyla obscurior]|uniref:Uncharacterized protein n=1 Tax=Cardiocondyla obscurior TaxID=286306 RepID=A0AAW2GFN4_9HYME
MTKKRQGLYRNLVNRRGKFFLPQNDLEKCFKTIYLKKINREQNKTKQNSGQVSMRHYTAIKLEIEFYAASWHE